MKNIIKMLSRNKDYRLVIADTYHISEKELNNFKGSGEIRKFLEQIITNCILLSGMNDFSQKISFSLRLSGDISIFCMITDSRLSIEFSDKLGEFKGTMSGLFDNKSVLSITTGDWETGLHTGTVEAHIDNVDMLFAHFSVQSEQLPSHFITAGDNATRGVLFQPLPFAEESIMSKVDDELVYLSKTLEESEWDNVPNIYSHLAVVISESKVS